MTDGTSTPEDLGTSSVGPGTSPKRARWWGWVSLTLAAAIVAVFLVLVAGSSSDSNGISKDNPREAVLAITKALMGQSSVTAVYHETVNEDGAKLDIGATVILTNGHSFSVEPSLHIVLPASEKGGVGTPVAGAKIINQLGASGALEVRYVGAALYVHIPALSRLSSLISQIPAAKLSKAGLAELATLGNKWISLGHASIGTGSTMTLFTPQRILNLVKSDISANSKAFSISSSGSVDGRSVVKLSSNNREYVYVASSGPALPVRVSGVAGSHKGSFSVDFTYGPTASISAPANSISLSTIEKAIGPGTIPASAGTSVGTLMTWLGSYDQTPKSLGLLELVAPIESAFTGVIGNDQTAVADATALSVATDAVAIGAVEDSPATYGDLVTALGEASGVSLNTATTTSGAPTTASSAVLGSAEIVSGETCVMVKFTGLNGSPIVAGACSGG